MIVLSAPGTCQWADCVG